MWHQLSYKTGIPSFSEDQQDGCTLLHCQNKAHGRLCWSMQPVLAAGRISPYSFADLRQHGKLQDKLYPKAKRAWKTELSLASGRTVSIPKSAKKNLSISNGSYHILFSDLVKAIAVSESKAQTANGSLGGKGRYEHSTFTTALLADWWVQKSDFNSYDAGPHAIVQMLNVRLRKFCGLDSLIIIKYSSPESHMLSLAIFLLRKTTLFQMFLSWWIATLPVLGNGCILPVRASVRGVSFKIAVSIKNTSWLYGNANMLKGFKVTIHLRHLCPGPCNTVNCFPWKLFFYCSGWVLFWEPSAATEWLLSNTCCQLRQNLGFGAPVFYNITKNTVSLWVSAFPSS